MRQEFEEENAEVEQPYHILSDSEVDPRIASFVDWMGGLDHVFSVLQGIPLESDLASNRGTKGDTVGVALDSPAIKGALPRTLTFSPLLFTKSLIEAELDGKQTDWDKKRECVELGLGRIPLHYQVQHRAGTEAMQAANHDALEVASQRAVRRYVKVLASWGTDVTKEDAGRQAQARTLTGVGISDATAARVQREQDGIVKEMARINDACVVAQPIPLEARKPKEAVGASQPFNAREALRAV